MDEARLGPCPFCGGQAELRQNWDYNTGEPLERGWFVICPSCDLVPDQAWGASKAEVVAAWNTRALTLPSEEEIARVIEAHVFTRGDTEPLEGADFAARAILDLIELDETLTNRVLERDARIKRRIEKARKDIDDGVRPKGGRFSI